jgi:uncharacterized protein
MENFTPVSATIGGVFIGFSATLLLLFNGRIAGISGILGGLIIPSPGERLWRALFLAGLVISGFIYRKVFPDIFYPRPDYPLVLLMLGGFIVGFGSRMGGGCTSGHGVCGIGRLSGRSIVATLVFILTGMITVYMIRHLLGITI